MTHWDLLSGRTLAKGELMNKRKALGAALITLSAPGLIAALAWAPAASGDPITESDTQPAATTTSTVVTEEECTWYMLGAPSDFVMLPGVDGAGPDLIEYTGEALQLSATLASNLNVYSSGNVNVGSATTNSECTFYGNVVRPVVTMSVTDTIFDATYGGTDDNTLDFTADAADDTFAITLTADAQCSTDGWNVASPGFYDDGSTPVLSVTAMDLPLVSVTSPVATDAGDRCKTTAMAASVTIPAAGAGVKPASPGATYTWTGPTVTTTLSTSGS